MFKSLSIPQLALTNVEFSRERKRHGVVDRDVCVDAADLEERRDDAPRLLRTHPRAVGDGDRVVGLSETDPDLVLEGKTGSLEVHVLVT